jgi:hypothetical protein
MPELFSIKGRAGYVKAATIFFRFQSNATVHFRTDGFDCEQAEGATLAIFVRKSFTFNT